MAAPGRIYRMKLEIHPRADAKLKAPVRTPTRMRASEGVVLHCTGGRRPSDPSKVAARIRITYDTHVVGNGWSDIGYSFIVDPFGGVWEARGWGAMTAATKALEPSLNTRTHAIVVQGDGTELTDLERCAILALIDEHNRRYGEGFVIGHRDVSSKSCPGPAVYAKIVRALNRPMR